MKGRRRGQQGYTLLEVLVATTIMAIAVTALVSNLTGSLRNLSRLTETDRAALLTKRKLEEVLLWPTLPRVTAIEGAFDQPIPTDGGESGWRVQVVATEIPENPGPGMPVLDRIEIEAWWKSGARRKTYSIVTYRRGQLTEADFLGSGGGMRR